MKFTATGDYLVTRRVPQGDKDFAQIKSVIQKADANITNLEMTFLDREATPSLLNGGYGLFTTPDRLEDLKDYGFNLVGFANNHTLDYSYEGLEQTLQHLDAYHLNHAGAGINKAHASKPAYIDLNGKRVALIACVSTAYRFSAPGGQRDDMKGRPGPNMLPYEHDLKITSEDFQTLKRIVDESHIANIINHAIYNGFFSPLPDGTVFVGWDYFGNTLMFQESDTPGATTHPKKRENAAIIQAVKDARLAADYVVVNLHAHEFEGEDNSKSAAFIEIAARSWVDAGADAVVIQGAHVTRGIEIYSGHPIFYGLGNFIFQQDTITAASQDFYDTYAQSPTETMNQIFTRLKENPNWLSNFYDAMTSIFVQWEIDEDGKLRDITLYPIELGYDKPVSQNGFPKLSDDQAILDRVIGLSEAYGTKIIKEQLMLDDGVAITVGKVVL